MQFTFTLADKIDPVAVYAALVATMVFAWNVYVWRNSGPRLNVTANMNMLVIGGSADEEKKFFLIVRGTNVGSKKTTITNVVILSYDNIWHDFVTNLLGRQCSIIRAAIFRFRMYST